jgi:hypothetical protein
VGGPYSDGAAYASGAVFAFRRDAGGAWELEQVVSHPDFGFGSKLGNSIALVEPDVFVAGAPSYRTVVLFRRDAGGAWAVAGEYAGMPSTDYGHAVAVSGHRVVIGAPTSCCTPPFHEGEVYFASLCLDCAVPFGLGTAGCDGAQGLSVSKPAVAGASALLAGDAAGAAGLGLLAIATGATPAGADPFGLGVEFLIDVLPPSAWFLLPVQADAAGAWSVSIPVPATAALAGATVFAQGFFGWQGCAVSLSSTSAVALAILAP